MGQAVQPMHWDPNANHISILMSFSGIGIEFRLQKLIIYLDDKEHPASQFGLALVKFK